MSIESTETQGVSPTRRAVPKSYDQIKQQCIALGLQLSDRLYLEGKSDFVILEGGGAMVFYNSTTGYFFGTTDQGVEFDNTQVDHEQEPWFQTLLDFFLWQQELTVPDEVPA
jgi:hypothetical protein